MEREEERKIAEGSTDFKELMIEDILLVPP